MQNNLCITEQNVKLTHRLIILISLQRHSCQLLTAGEKGTDEIHLGALGWKIEKTANPRAIKWSIIMMH
jgi:hypothetical protein